eukprot:Hpha_TRINITY_DN16899_c5_g1::TRINITY_DN16899_c5_g1_i1::g.148741::m.148741
MGKEDAPVGVQLREASSLEKALDATTQEGKSSDEHTKGKQDTLQALCATEHGKGLLRELMTTFDACLEWVEKHPETEAPGEAAEAADGVEEEVPETEKEKQKEFLDQMAARAEEMRTKGDKKERTIQFTDDAPPAKLLDWVESLPGVTPSLGYVAPKHVANLAATIKRVMGGAGKRVGEREKLARFLESEGSGEGVEAGVVSLALKGPHDGFELFLAGVLY